MSMTEEEVLALPVTVDLMTTARALGIGRTRAYELARTASTRSGSSRSAPTGIGAGELTSSVPWASHPLAPTTPLPQSRMKDRPGESPPGRR